MYQFITLIFVIGYISSESISSQSWSNLIQDLSLKIHDEKNIESHPLNEGFILISENQSKTSKKPDNRIFKSNNISSTTCRTIVILKTNKKTSPPPILDHSIGHLGRRLLNEPSHNTDDGEFESFMKVNDDELSKQLFNMDLAMDGSGEMTESTTQQTTTSTTTPPSERIILPNNTTFILTMNCTNMNNTIEKILNELKDKFGYEPTNPIEPQCNLTSGTANVSLNFFSTDNSVEELTQLFKALYEIATANGAQVLSDNLCVDSGTVPLVNLTSCFIIDLCHLCGTNPLRGICLPNYNETKCDCLPNRNDSSRPYVGQFCYTSEHQLSKPSDWTPVIVGVLAGVTGLFCLVTLCLWVTAVWHRQSHPEKNDLRVRRLWHLPRAQMPTAVTSENVDDYLNNTISTLSSHRTDSDYNRSNTTDSTFFKELDQKMGENLRATITRPNTSAMLASLPSDTISTLSSYDPIDELDAIIDNEDINTTFHDPLDDLFEDNEVLEAINPNLKLSRPNIDSKPTGLFSYFYSNW